MARRPPRRRVARRDDRRPAHLRGYDRAWRRARDEHLRAEPLCRHCLQDGRTTPATEVDHIVPFRGPDDPLRLDPQNLQSLCHACHVAKTAGEVRFREKSGTSEGGASVF